jgi:hypothetical protein
MINMIVALMLRICEWDTPDYTKRAFIKYDIYLFQ